jgi:hypothetical protein
VSRASLRTGIASFFGGPTYDDVVKIYRPTPLASNGLAGVRPYWTERFRDPTYLASLVAGSTMGAVMCVHLPDQDEGRVAMGGVVSGVKSDLASVELWIFHLAATQYEEDAQIHLDALLDAVKALIRGDRTLGGICTQAGEGGSRLHTRTGLPVFEPGTPPRITQECVITFRADAYLNA